MPRGRKLAAFTAVQRIQLESVAQSTSMPHGLVQRARIVLACAEGVTNAKVAAQLGVSASTVGKSRRFLQNGVHGLHDELRFRRPRTYDDERVARLINRPLQEKPPHRKGKGQGLGINRGYEEFADCRINGFAPRARTGRYVVSVDIIATGVVPHLSPVRLGVFDAHPEAAKHAGLK